MAYSFPNVSFDWLGELPGIAEGARLSKARREALADMESATPDELEKRANRLLGAGDVETGMKLYTAALSRRELARRSAADTQYSRNLPRLLELYRAGPQGAAAPEGGAPPELFPAPAPSGAGYNFGPNPLAPRSALPPAGPPVAAAPPSPSEEMLAAAEGGGPGRPPLGPQFAQAGGPPVAVPPSPQGPGGLPPWAVGAQMSVAAPPPPPPPPPRPGLSPEQQAMEEAKHYGSMLMLANKNPAAIAAIKGPFQNALDRAKLSQHQKDLARENFDRVSRGEPTLTMSEYEGEKEVRKPQFEAGLKLYTDYKAEERKARNFSGSIAHLDAIVNHPKFEAGAGTQTINSVKSVVRNLKDAAIANGIAVPDNIVRAIDDATTSVQLREAFNAIASTAVFDKLGTLGNQISEGDRNFVTLSFPSLMLSKEGNKLIIEYYKEVNKKNIELGQLVTEKYREKQKGGKLSPLDIDDAVNKYWSDPKNDILSKDGKPTELGRRLQAEADKVRGEREASPPTQAPPAPTGGRPVIGPDGKRYRFLNGQLIPEQE